MNAVNLTVARRNFFKSLPQRLTCPCCEKSRKKEMFGIRLMNGGAVQKEGAEPLFYRQSYCGECRS